MLVLYETPAGFTLFKVLNEKKVLAASGDVGRLDQLFSDSFASPDLAHESVKLVSACKFANTADALSSATALLEGKMSKDLKSFLKTELEGKKEKLAVADPKLAASISKKLGIDVVSDSAILEVVRGIKCNLESLISSMVSQQELSAMSLGLAHSLSRYKLKFSPDKVDTMIVQAISLLDDLDKELNTYCMRLKEWYGWHFPELAKILVDNVAFAKCVRAVGFRFNASATDLSAILPEELEEQVKRASETSMGTEISDHDLENIGALADQVIAMSEYRGELFSYLKNRMLAIAPNLTCMVGELVGARLISHAGSLMNLAKQPASTVQILGAEKALFRALKTKNNTPKYGLLFHASLVGQAAPKLKGKISRVLAAKTALAVRVDALGDKDTKEVGTDSRLKVEQRLRQLEGRARTKLFGSAKTLFQSKKQDFGAGKDYNPANDIVMETFDKKTTKKEEEEKVVEKVESPAVVEEKKKEKKDKKDKKDKKRKAEDDNDSDEKEKKDKKKKKKSSS